MIKAMTLNNITTNNMAQAIGIKVKSNNKYESSIGH
jgi:hypothetical protein